MRWSEDERDGLTDLRWRRERGGYQPEAVDVLVEAVTACMSAGRQIPDPTTFALPTRAIGHGYARSQVRELVEHLRALRRSGAEAEAAEQAAAKVDQEPAPTAPVSPVRRGGSGPSWDQAQLDWVRTKRFSSVRRGGYDAGEVDDLLDAVLVAMAHGDPLPDIEKARFTASKAARTGYDVREVDGFLDELRAQAPRG